MRRASFFVHLAIEKALKACVVEATRDLPPRRHDLLFLADQAGTTLSPKQRDYLEGRYPGELPPPPAAREVTRDLNTAEEMVLWLTSRLSNP